MVARRHPDVNRLFSGQLAVGVASDQFVDRMRVEAAPQMIDSSSMELKEIGDACGFRVHGAVA
jgi:transcriptional regulator GlxA family with amidase domain